MNPKPKEKVRIPTTVELHTIADKIGPGEKTVRFKDLCSWLVGTECASVK